MSANLEGKVVLVTGANTGIGEATALELARRGARVLVHGRSASKVDAAVGRIREAAGHDRVEPAVADLARLEAVRGLADHVLGATDRLDVLVNNAGLILSERTQTPDGYETTFAVNHLAPFLLTHLLRARLAHSAPARVVTVSSRAHTRSPGLDFDDLMFEKRPYTSFAVYGASKLANVLFTRELARRLEGEGVVANCCHPGVIGSGFGRDGDLKGIMGVAIRIARPLLKSPTDGAATSVFLAASPEAAEVSGRYFSDRREVTPSKAARDDDAGRRLWEVSLSLTGLSG